LRIEEEFAFVLPPQSRVEYLPEVRENKAGPLRWRAEWTKVAEDKITARFQAELGSGELSADETIELQRQLMELFGAFGACASFSYP
jgi:hypothetical protein